MENTSYNDRKESDICNELKPDREKESLNELPLMMGLVKGRIFIEEKDKIWPLQLSKPVKNIESIYFGDKFSYIFADNQLQCLENRKNKE